MKYCFIEKGVILCYNYKRAVLAVDRNNIWNKAKRVCIQTSEDIVGNFDICFKGQISKEIITELQNFVSWVEENFYLPVTLWVDFEYKHYLIRRDRKKVGYLFYYADFTSYPAFNNKDDIPQIRLAVRTEYNTIEEILVSFIEAISCYFAWVCNIIDDEYIPNESEVEEILQEYLKTR